VKINRIVGSLLGLALGDALGAPHEGGIIERIVWNVIGTNDGKRRWTDDTQMTIDVIESLVELGQVDQDDLAHRFANSYRWSRGYGAGAAKVLRRIRRGQPWRLASRAVYHEGSFGNGGAMRAPAVGLFYATGHDEELVKAACAAAAVTHAHPLAQEGAVLIALATVLAYKDTSSQDIIEHLYQRTGLPEFMDRLHKAQVWLHEEDIVEPRTVAAELGNGISALESCVTAIYVALTFRESSFSELMEFTIRIGGDVDTIASMAGAVWGAARGLDALPKAQLERLEECERLKDLARILAKAAGNRHTSRLT
jgi:ADP-ribosylglycohydrolase